MEGAASAGHGPSQRRWDVRKKIGAAGVIGAALLLALGVSACGSSSSSDTSSAAASAAASASPAAAATTTVAMGQLPEVVHARVGDTITVMLHSNTASTGYQWVTQDLNDAAVLKQNGDGVVIAPKSKMVGAPGHTKFTFTVEKEGVDEVGFWYQPPGGGTAGATWALVVKAAAGHVPVNVDAGEDYTAETAQMRVGDSLVVSIGNAAELRPPRLADDRRLAAAQAAEPEVQGRQRDRDLRRRVRRRHHPRDGEPADRRPAAADLRASGHPQGAEGAHHAADEQEGRRRELRAQDRRHHPGVAARTSRPPTSSGSSRSPTPRSSSRSASPSSSPTTASWAPRARWSGPSPWSARARPR